jgi:hypothetical protein
MLIRWAAALLLAYLLGAFPTGPLVARLYGVDLTQYGSRRTGATNALRVLGKPAGALVLGGVAGGLGIGAAAQLPRLMAFLAARHRRHRVALRLPTADGNLLTIRGAHLTGVELLGDRTGQWLLRVPHEGGEARFGGDEGLRAAAFILPRVNAAGASEARLEEALRLLEGAGDPVNYFAVAARRLPRTRRVVFGEVFYGKRSHYGALERLLPAQRLALEMAAHEESERRALEGELALLAQAWRDAEEIAAIADGLLVPASVEEFLRREGQEARDRGREERPGGG